MQVRFELTQAVDAQRYAADGGAGGAAGGAARRTRLLEAALAEAPSGRCSLPEAAALLWLLLSGKLDAIQPEALWVRPALQHRLLASQSIRCSVAIV